MDDKQILTRIRELVDDEHQLRERLRRGEITSAEEQARLRHLEESLDQCWDLLRQRRARAEFREDPDTASARPAEEVEGYWQ